MAGTPRMMIFIPFDPEAARAVRATGHSDVRRVGYAATAQLIEAHGYRPDEREDADYAAQLYASIAGLIDISRPTGAAEPADHPVPDRRLVVAADIPIARVSDHDADGDYGAVRIAGLDWSDVTAVFVDEDAAKGAVGRAREEIRRAPERRLDAVLELPAVTALTDAHELLWHLPAEAW